MWLSIKACKPPKCFYVSKAIAKILKQSMLQI